MSIGEKVSIIVVVILMFVEIVPVKISPLAWLGKRLNRETLNQVEKIEKKLDDHVAQSLRSKIMFFQDDIIANKPKTREQWKEVIVAISKYETYCEENHIDNGLCKQANNYLLDEYMQRLKNKTI